MADWPKSVVEILEENAFVGMQKWAKGADIASASTLVPGADGNYFHVTGTTTITAIATEQAGTLIFLKFNGACQITHHATSLILQGAVNYTTVAGDVLAFLSEGAGNWREAFRWPTTAPIGLGANSFTGIQRWAKGADIASASSLTLGTDGNYVRVTGTTTITAISTAQAGTIIALRFAGALTLTHHATNLILQGGVNATTAAGDVYLFVSEGSGQWREIGRALTAGMVFLAANNFTGTQRWAKGANIASASTVNFGTDGNAFHITGTTTITAFGSLQAGTIVVLTFDGVLTLTHHATSLILMGGINHVTAAGDTFVFVSEGSGNWREVARNVVNERFAPLLTGTCRVTRNSATQLGLTVGTIPLKVNGVWTNRGVTSALTLSPSVSADTTYYLYAFDNAGTTTLEESTTGPATDATTGVRIKTGDATRTLVGMVRSNGSSQFSAATASDVFIISWFNRQLIGLTATLASDRTTTSTTPGNEINTEMRCEFLTWAEDTVTAMLASSGSNDTASQYTAISVGFDGTTEENRTLLVHGSGREEGSASVVSRPLAVGYHYATMTGFVSSGTGTYKGGASRTRLSVLIYG